MLTTKFNKRKERKKNEKENQGERRKKYKTIPGTKEQKKKNYRNGGDGKEYDNKTNVVSQTIGTNEQPHGVYWTWEFFFDRVKKK